jgi:hypothetical protein
VAFGLALCLFAAPAARAADATAMVGGAVSAIGSTMGSLWSSVTSLFVGGNPYDYLPGQISDDDKRFFAALNAVGLELSEIKVGGGTFSHSSYRFVAARDPSDVDLQRGERELEDYTARAGGLRAAAKQRIIRAVLDVAGDKNFILTAVVVDLWPWPSVSYEMTARNRPPEAGERRVIDATQPQ